jgi:hypothetical protein
MWIPAVAGSGLIVLLIATSCGNPDAAPSPVPAPTTSASSSTSSVTLPVNNDITVRATTTTTPPPPPPEPVTTKPEVTTQVVPPVQPPPPPVQTTKQTPPWETPRRGLFAEPGAPCESQGAFALSRRGKPMVCSPDGHGKLHWQES